ncbi:hypothetical protein [Gordonia phage GTE5]|uniref:Uncharacterized protein n=1 Tax=Gordonia phage GTE5 TaxID=319522 RepID=G8EJL9_9CAUD|nr:membrane protein [Gordonia phage GTE5]AET09751.1 hypothetical protein [Gordonia phage GTE5]
MPIEPDGKMTGIPWSIAVETDEPKTRTTMSPTQARGVAAHLVNMANEAEGKPNYRVALKNRWKPGGARDAENRLIGFGLGAALLAAVNAISEGDPVYWVLFALTTAASGVLYWMRRDGDAKDLNDEFREKVHGTTIDQSSGVLPWDVR